MPRPIGLAQAYDLPEFKIKRKKFFNNGNEIVWGTIEMLVQVRVSLLN